MNINRLTIQDTKALLSTLWIFVLLNILFRDIHELLREGALQEMLTGQVSETTLLIAGIALQIPLLMVVLSRLMPTQINRWANIGAAGIVILVITFTGVNDLDDMWFMVVEIIGLLSIAWVAWQLPTAEHTPPISKQSPIKQSMLE